MLPWVLAPFWGYVTIRSYVALFVVRPRVVLKENRGGGESRFHLRPPLFLACAIEWVDHAVFGPVSFTSIH